MLWNARIGKRLVPACLIAGMSLALVAGEDSGRSARTNRKTARVAVLGGITAEEFGPKLPPAEASARVETLWLNKIADIRHDRPDIIVIPEAANWPWQWYGATEERNAFASEHATDFVNLMRRAARENHCYICAPVIRTGADGKLRNSIVLIDRDGEVAATYNKTFPTIHEIDTGVVAGQGAICHDADFGRIGFVICFDLNFPELLEQYAALQPDLLVFSSIFHGDLLQNWWALRCRSYLAGATTQTGCTLVNPLGQRIRSSSNYSDFLVVPVDFDYQVVHLDYNADKLAAAKRDLGLKIDLFDPGRLGRVLLTSRDPSISSAAVMQRYGIMPLDDYYDRSRERRSRAVESRSDCCRPGPAKNLK